MKNVNINIINTRNFNALWNHICGFEDMAQAGRVQAAAWDGWTAIKLFVTGVVKASVAQDVPKFDLQLFAGFETAVAFSTMGVVASMAIAAADKVLPVAQAVIGKENARRSRNHWLTKAHEAAANGDYFREEECRNMAKEAQVKFDLQLFANKEEGSARNTTLDNTPTDRKDDTIMVAQNNKKVNYVAQHQKDLRFGEQVIKNSLDTRQVKYQSLSFTQVYTDGKPMMFCEGDIVTFGMNKMTRRYYDEAFGQDVNLVAGGMLRRMKNVYVDQEVVRAPFTGEMLALSFRGFDKETAAMYAELVRDNGVRIQYAGDGDVYVWLVAPVGTKGDAAVNVYHIAGEAKVPMLQIGARNDAAFVELAKKGTFETYSCYYAGPSNERQESALVFRVHNGESMTDFKARMTHELDEMSGGVMTTLSEMFEGGKKVAYEKFFKKVSRLSLAFTPMTPSMSAHSFAFYNGAFGDTGLSDGQWIMNGDLLARHYGLDGKNVYGMGLQARVIDGIIAKGMAIPVSGKDMSIILTQYGQLENVSYNEFRQMWLNGTLKKNTMYRVGDFLSETAYIFDDNTLKMVGTEPEIANGFQLNILQVRTATAGKLNGQDAACMQHLDGAVDFVENLGRAHIDAEVEKVMNIFAGNVVEGVIDPAAYYPQLLGSICPAYASHNADLMMDIIKNTAKGLTRAVDKFSFPLNCRDEYRYLQSDYADMFSCLGLKVLGEHHVYDAAELVNSIDVNLTRNPKADGKENYSAVTDPIDEVLANVDALDCSDALKDVIKRAYLNASNGLIITPADECVSASLGGSDFDGDGSTVHKNPDYIAIQAQEPEGSSNIPKPEASGRMADKFDVDVMSSVMIDGTFGQEDENGSRSFPAGVGVLNNHGMKIFALRTADDQTLTDVMEQVIIPNLKLLGFKQTSEAYERRYDTPDVEIHNSDVLEATNAFYNSDWSLTSLRNYIEDCCRMNSSVLGRGIDVNKTGEHVLTGILGVLSGKDIDGERIKKANTTYLVDAVTREAIFQKDEEGHISFMMVVPENAQPNEKAIALKSSLSDVRFRLMEYAEARINELFTMVENYAVPIATEEKWMAMGLGADKVDQADLQVAANIYRSLTSNPALQTEEKNYIREKTARMIRSYMFSADAKASERAVAMRRAATIDGRVTAFQRVLKEEYMQWVLYVAEQEGFAMNTKVGYKAVVRDSRMVNEGEYVVMHNGFDITGNVAAGKKVNGSFKLERINGNYYLTMDAKEAFKVPANTFADSKADSIVLRMKDFVTTKEVSKNNSLPEVAAMKGNFARISNWTGDSSLIFDKEGETKWNMYVARHEETDNFGNSRYVLTNTRFNTVIKNNGIRISEVFQWREGDHIHTIVTGRLVNCAGKAMPKVQPVVSTASADEINSMFSAEALAGLLG